MSRTSTLGKLRVGTGQPVRVMAAINASPESFYKGSVVKTSRELLAQAESAIREGADVLDVGAMSTAPYLQSEVSEDVEMRRMLWVLPALSGLEVVVSVDTVRSRVAETALRHGATVINDVSGLKNDPKMAVVIREHGASLVAMAHSTKLQSTKPIVRVREALKETLTIADRAGIDLGKVVLDPGVGFFRKDGAGSAFSPQELMPWPEWDVDVLSKLAELEELGRPLCVGLSRKSFLGKILRLEAPEDRLAGSLAATGLAVANGADMVRTHDVRETVQAIRVAEAITGRPGRRPS